MMKTGIGKSIITPPIGTPLSGFGARDHGSEGILDDLKLRVIWIQEDDDVKDALCIVTADVIGFPIELTEQIRTKLNSKYGIAKERILLAASHTHSGPALDNSLVGTGDSVPEVIDDIICKIYKAIEDAYNSQKEAYVSAGKGICSGYAINRRVTVDGNTVMAPNPDGIRDDQVSVIAFKDVKTDEEIAVLFSYTCHPSTMGDYNITADFPGVARRTVEDNIPKNAIAAFLPGCFGDIRSYCTLIGSAKFRAGTHQDILEFGEGLGTEVIRVLNESTEKYEPHLGAQILDIELPSEKIPTSDEIEDKLNNGNKFEKKWAKQMKAGNYSPTRKFQLQRIDIAKDLKILAMSGEVCCEYGLFAKKLKEDEFILPLGYSNGSSGYIPTKAMFPDGGYEPNESWLYYGMPSRFKPSVEDIVQNAIRNLIETV